MNKKQGIIIATLLVLIVCAGVLATKLNNPLYVNGDDSGSGKSSAVSFNNSSQKNNKTSSFFEETRLDRDQKNAQTLQTLKNFIDDKNVSKENRDEASKKYTDLAMNTNYESKIETTLKSKGYEDVICSIEDSKARVIVKGKDKLTDKDTREIKNVVVGIAKIQDVEIEVKQ
ncbi:SpoIIIAH-like family protein [Clostridiaceae bacterium UIB06]|uniref:SpoIIIAH-like family protein n=1 Tax=Clostridium thailandense TaxID=2794346 RepID=A0A949WSG6_9CLOT|nr:SpoIIIAH-like family protein [Clostridium thailandense]MBV7275061.1 SpoIIIAH-like family protein [Clostridium thailandense]MCH5136575.1 SpoIIIAH-like family protein [Clostridiaceae bacterium UIB06]